MTADGLLLGIDVGTTRLKAALVDACGEVAAAAAVPTPFAPVPDGVELTVDQLADALRRALAALPAGGRERVAAVGVGGLAESGAPLAGGRPVGPVIAWHDGRGEEVAVRLADRLGDAYTSAIGQRPRSVSSVAKLGWLLEHGLGRVERWLGVPELCLWLLTGAQATDFSLAARTGAYDIGRRMWLPEALEVAGIPAGVFCDPGPAGTALGEVTAKAAEEYGLPSGIPVTLAGHDHLAAAEPLAGPDGWAYNSVGTAECLVGFARELPDVARAVELRLAVTLRPAGNGYAVFAGAARPGIVLRPVVERHARPVAEIDADPAADDWAAAVGELSGRTAGAAGRLAGLLGPAGRVVAFGGGSALLRWMAVKAGALAPTPLFRAAVAEAAARGGALAAGVAAGWWPSVAAGPPVPLVPVPPGPADPAAAAPGRAGSPAGHGADPPQAWPG